jgi:hypothetical protein
MNQKLQNLFEEYAKASLKGTPKDVARFYDKNILMASPKGRKAFVNDQTYLEFIASVQKGFQATGITGLDVVNVDVRELTPAYTLADVEWGARFKKTGAETIRFTDSYVLTTDEPPKIVAVFSHQDEQTELKNKGILAAPSTR